MPFATASDPTDRSDLHQHLQQCAHARGRLHGLRCAIEAVDTFLAPRIVSTLGTMTVLMLAGLAWVAA